MQHARHACAMPCENASAHSAHANNVRNALLVTTCDNAAATAALCSRQGQGIARTHCAFEIMCGTYSPCAIYSNHD
jgi:hypothetical protein